jgi:hypothetical protein
VAGIAGFALLGVGIAVVLPLAFAAAGRMGSHAGQAIAGVATVTYVTGLAAPTLIGTIGELASLRVSFGVVAAAVTVMALSAGVLGTGRGASVSSGDGERPRSSGSSGSSGSSQGGGHPAHGVGEHLG